jgi:hypothetical protein
MQYKEKMYNAANTEITLLRKYIFLLQLVSTFDISIVEFSDGLRQYLCAALYHLCLLSLSPLFWFRWLIATLTTDTFNHGFPKPLPSVR